MESAIPDHLKTARTHHTRYGDDYTPPYPGFVARHKPTVSSVVMAYFGLQFRPADEAASAAALARLTSALGADHGPGHWDRARYTDEAGYETIVTIAYWDEPQRFDTWFAAQGAAWTGEEKPGPLGYFTEIHGDPPHIMGLFGVWKRAHDAFDGTGPVTIEIEKIKTYTPAPMLPLKNR